jgi:uncharacterized protein
MKKIILTLILGFVFLNSYSQNDIKIIDISKEVLSSFTKKEYVKIISFFDETMKKALTADGLKLVWEQQLPSQTGKFIESGKPFTETKEGYQIVYIPCKFEKTNLNLQLAFNKENKVSGLYFRPITQ